MAPTLAEVTRLAKQLPSKQRWKLIAALLRMPEDGEKFESPANVKKAWDDEIKRRMEVVRSGKVTLIPWSEVKRRLDKKYGKISSGD